MSILTATKFSVNDIVFMTEEFAKRHKCTQYNFLGFRIIKMPTIVGGYIQTICLANNHDWCFHEPDLTYKKLEVKNDLQSRISVLCKVPLGHVFRDKKEWYKKIGLMTCLRIKTYGHYGISTHNENNKVFVLNLEESQKIDDSANYEDYFGI